jgi:hypothetical protein
MWADVVDDRLRWNGFARGLRRGDPSSRASIRLGHVVHTHGALGSAGVVGSTGAVRDSDRRRPMHDRRGLVGGNIPRRDGRAVRRAVSGPRGGDSGHRCHGSAAGRGRAIRIVRGLHVHRGANRWRHDEHSWAGRTRPLSVQRDNSKHGRRESAMSRRPSTSKAPGGALIVTCRNPCAERTGPDPAWTRGGQESSNPDPARMRRDNEPPSRDRSRTNRGLSLVNRGPWSTSGVSSLATRDSSRS